jgi:DHA2 family multidrug resistance protein
MSDPVPAGGEASATGETQSLVHHPPHTEHDVSGAPDRVAPTVNRVAITISIMLATIMQAIDTTIANVALPHIQGSLSAAQDQITWVLTSYIVAAAIMTPLTGWLAPSASSASF